MVSGAFLITSCSKEMIEPQGSTTETPQKNFAVSEQGVTQITDFLTVYENWKANPNTTFNDMAKEDAIWLMEASINYKNAFQLSYWEGRKTTETSFTPTLVEGSSESFTGSSILSTFALMDAAITNQKNNNNHNMILVVDLYLDEENSSQIVMQGTSANSIPVSTVTNPIGIEADDYWMPSGAPWAGGKCGPYSGFPNMDAAERVEDIINHNWFFNYYRNIYNPIDIIYHSNISTVWVPTNGGGNPNGCWGVHPNVCQDPNDMMGILSEDKNAVLRAAPTGNQLIFADVRGSIITGTTPSYALHDANVTYGIPHVQ